MTRLACLLASLAVAACAHAPAPAAAQVPAPEAQPRTISVNATAEVRRAPDRAVISLAVETTAATAAEASSRNAEQMSRVLEAIRRLGIDREDIQTRRVELSPRYERMQPGREDQQPRIAGYVATNQVVVTVDDIGMVGQIVDAGIAAGANRVSGISFELRDPEAAHHEALRLAVQRATREARVVAEALGEPLGPALTVSTSAYMPPPQPMAMRARVEAFDAQQMPTPVEPGELDVQATVSITFRIGT